MDRYQDLTEEEVQLLHSGRDYYAILGVAPTAPREIVKAAWRTHVKLLHPDARPTDSQGSSERWRAIQDSFTVLGDERLRAFYDEQVGLRDAEAEDEWGQMTPGQALATKFILTAAQEIEDRVDGSGTNESTFEHLDGGSILLMFEIDSDKAPTYAFLYEIDPLGRYRTVYGKGTARPRDAVKVGRKLWADPDWSAPVTEVDLRSAGGE